MSTETAEMWRNETEKVVLVNIKETKFTRTVEKQINRTQNQSSSEVHKPKVH